MTQTTSADVKVDEQFTDPLEVQTDPFKAIIEDQERIDREALETMQKALESEDGSVEEATPKSETSPDAPNATSPNGETGRSSNEGKRPGVDVLLKDIETNLSPEHADVVRGFITENREQNVERKDADLRMKELELQVSQLTQDRTQTTQPATDPPAETKNPLLDNIPEGQMEIFKAMAEDLGYVRQDTLDAEDQQAQTEEYHTTNIDKGIETYGETFGARNEQGQFTFATDIKSEVQGLYQRIHEEQNLTAQDLYKIATYDEMMTKKADEPAALVSSDNGRSTARPLPAFSERNNAPGTTSANYYHKGDDLDAVVARASGGYLRGER